MEGKEQISNCKKLLFGNKELPDAMINMMATKANLSVDFSISYWIEEKFQEFNPCSLEVGKNWNVNVPWFFITSMVFYNINGSKLLFSFLKFEKICLYT
jgi:hypothetical protein